MHRADDPQPPPRPEALPEPDSTHPVNPEAGLHEDTERTQMAGELSLAEDMLIEARDPLVGTVLDGKYRIEAPLGNGGSCRVYLARQVSLNRRVALKVMRPEIDPDGQRRFADRFFREASLAGNLQHPNVVTVHDYGRTSDGTCYIAMELLGGRSLKDLMREGPLPVERCLLIFEQIVRGLRAAHQAGLVHRDVKPGNVQVRPGDDGSDHVKLLDFGLVRDQEAPSDITDHGHFLGTPHYAAPEQVKGVVADHRADLYATGVMLYRALTGVLPFDGEHPMAIAISHVKDPYPPMKLRAPEVSVPPELEAIVRRCLEKEPAARYPDAASLMAELVSLRRKLFPEAHTVGGVPSPLMQAAVAEPAAPAEAPQRGLFGRIAVAAAGGALAAALVTLGVAAAGAWWFLQREPAPTGELAAAEDQASEEPASAEPALAEEQAVAAPEPAAAPEAAAAPAPAPRAERVERPEPPASRKEAPGEGSIDLAEDVAAPRIASAPAPAPAPAPSRSSGGGVVADGVSFSSSEAAAAVRWVNSASKEQLGAAGIVPKQVNIILEHRPFPDVSALAATYGIGEKTMQAVQRAAR